MRMRIDPGSEYAKVNNEWRSSWITSPADGRPPFSKAAMALRGERMENVKKVKNTGPEIRPLGERCFISFGSRFGAPPCADTISSAAPRGRPCRRLLEWPAA